MTDVHNSRGSVLTDITVDSLTVREMLMNLNEHSSPGPDELHPRVVKNLALVIAQPLARLFQKSLTDGRLPSGWKTAIVKTMFKCGKLEEPASYSPVSLTSVLCKLFERVIKKTIDQTFHSLGLWSSK